MGKEPTLVIQTTVAVLTAVQEVTIPGRAASVAHLVITILIVALGAAVNRSQVVPNSKIGA